MKLKHRIGLVIVMGAYGSAINYWLNGKVFAGGFLGASLGLLFITQ